jgi:hypothetical protein
MFPIFKWSTNPMQAVEHAAALLEALTQADVEAMPPARRRRFAAMCRRAAKMAEPGEAEHPKSGVLHDLRRNGSGFW